MRLKPSAAALVALGLIWSGSVLADFDKAKAAYARDDYATVFKELSVSAQAGEAKSQSFMGDLYRKGKGVPRDDAKALFWYRKAAEQGDPEAQINMGAAYGNGTGVPRDYGEALFWYRRAADQGQPVAQYDLGQLYNFGHGVAKDSVEAAVWYRKSAEQGYKNAQYNLGVMYENGEGMSRDYATAASWYRKSLAQGDPDAACALGKMIEKGWGLDKDTVQAYVVMCLSVALDKELQNHDVVCKDRLRHLEDTMTTDELDRAQTLLKSTFSAEDLEKYEICKRKD